MQATMELIDRQEYVSWKLPKDWHIILTTNPDNGDYNVTSLDVAQKTRFISVELKFDVDVWAKWAEQANIDGRCINFLLMHPESVTQRINPRAVTTFFNAISSIPDFDSNLPLIQMIGEGSVGPEFASLFTMFINNKLDKIISPQDILIKDEKYVVSTLRSIFGDEDSYRGDIASVVSTRLVNYSLAFAAKHSISQDMIDRLVVLSSKEDVFTEDLKYRLVKDIVNGNKPKFQRIMMNQEIIKMSLN